MKTIYSAALIAVAFTMSAAPSQARPAQNEVHEARVRMNAIRGQYMQLDRAPAKPCAAVFDGGENRFDRMYSNIGASDCRAQY